MFKRKNKWTYFPDIAIPPGETIVEAMEDRGWSQEELAKRIGKTKEETSNIINAKQKITADLALRLENVFGVSSTTWMNLQNHYDETLDKANTKTKGK